MQVKQAYFDAAGNEQELSIVAYHQALISPATPFSDCTHWPYNVAQHFVNNLAPIIKTQYVAEYHDQNQMVYMGMVQQEDTGGVTIYGVFLEGSIISPPRRSLFTIKISNLEKNLPPIFTLASCVVT
jgi:hypothetical protein